MFCFPLPVLPALSLPLPQYLFPTLLNVFIVFIGGACCLFLHNILNFIKCIVYLKEKKSINTLDSIDFQSDSDSFNPTLWEEQRQQRMTVAFEFEDKKEDDESAGKVKVNFWPLFLLLFCLSAVTIQTEKGSTK